MVGRLRQRAYGPIVGNGAWKLGVFYTQGDVGQTVTWQRCEDVIGNWNGDNKFNLKTVKREFKPMNGTKPGVAATDGSYSNKYGSNAVQITNHIADPGLPSTNAAALKALAGTNPNRPTVSVPRFVYELKDLPHLIKQGGDLLNRFNRSRKSPKDVARYLSSMRAARDGAGIYLGNEFAVKPLISDIRKMVDFASHIAKRKSELDRLYSKGGLKRRYRTYKNTVQTNFGDPTIDSFLGLTIKCRLQATSEREQWVTVRWLPDPGSIPPTDERKLKLARAAVFGALPDLSDVWAVMPWTWLFGWTNNMQDWFNANRRGIVACSPSRINVMTKTTTKWTWTRYGNEWCTGGDGTVTYTEKDRSLPSGILLPEANIPIMSDWRLSILGSLAVTRVG